MIRSSTATLPLHGGKAPRWLFNRMKKLAGAIAEAIVLNYNTKTLLERLSDAYWFQAFGNVLGFDWHSSGLTTTTIAALKEGIKNRDLELAVCGGKSAPKFIREEIEANSQLLGLNPEKMLYYSRFAARVDNNALIDNYDLYHHSIIFDSKGRWAIVQQGMNKKLNFARRYHWIYTRFDIEQPHNSISSQRIEKNVIDYTAKESRQARSVVVKAIKEQKEWLHILPERGNLSLNYFLNKGTINKNKELIMPKKHALTLLDLNKHSIEKLKKISQLDPSNFRDLIMLPGASKKVLRALALIAEIIYGEEVSKKDPALYSFAHGGKDGYPFPVNRDIYDNTILTLEEAIKNAKIGDKDKMLALKKLNEKIKVKEYRNYKQKHLNKTTV